MNHCGTQILETGRLSLRPFAEEDAPAMYKNWASDAEVTRFLTWPPHESAEATGELLREWAEEYNKKDYYQWAIVVKGEEGLGPVGSISAVAYSDRTDMIQIGYCLGRAWQRRGIMTEALSRVMEYFFHTVGENRIEALHALENPRSGQVMKRCGMIYEGTLRQAGRNNQGLTDLCCYAVLRTEWERGSRAGK